jgi:hypothetical protein
MTPSAASVSALWLFLDYIVPILLARLDKEKVIRHFDYDSHAYDETTWQLVDAWVVAHRLAPISRSVAKSVQEWSAGARALLLPENENDALRTIARDCPGLRSLFIGTDRYRREKGSIDDMALLPIASSCRDLQKLDLGSTAVKGFVMWALAAGCPKLTVLRVSENMDTSDLEPLAGRLLHLDLLPLYCLSRSDLASLAKWYINLQSLCAAVLNTVDARSVTFRTLRKLYLEIGETERGKRGCGLHAIPHCPSLRGLRFLSESLSPVEQITKMQSRRLVSANLQLELVSLVFQCGTICKGAIEALSALDRLTKLNLGTGGADFAADTDLDAELAVVFSKCPLITSLDFNIHYEISNATIYAIGQHCHRLERLKLDTCLEISSASIASLAHGACRDTLAYMNVFNCPVSRRAVKALNLAKWDCYTNYDYDNVSEDDDAGAEEANDEQDEGEAEEDGAGG